MDNDKHVIICIGRQLGSGGRIIAKKLAEHFGAKFYDRELLNLAAKESGFNEKFFEPCDEHNGLFHTLFHFSPYIGSSNFYGSNISQEGLFKFQSDAIRKAAEEGSCVFVGRCADYVLRDMKNMVSVFITANLDERIKQIMVRHSLDEAAAKRYISSGENGRASYYNYYTGKKWGDSSSYDLCVNSSLLGLEETEKYIANFIEKVKSEK